jgi:hypothetical protein
MHPSFPALQQQRELVLDEMRALDGLRRGSLSRQFFKCKEAGKTLLRGPYFLLQGFFRGKKFAERIPADQAEKVGRQVENYRRFQALADRFIAVSEAMARLAAPPPDSKKNSSRKRSPTSASAKPRPS